MVLHLLAYNPRTHCRLHIQCVHFFSARLFPSQSLCFFLKKIQSFFHFLNFQNQRPYFSGSTLIWSINLALFVLYSRECWLIIDKFGILGSGFWWVFAHCEVQFWYLVDHQLDLMEPIKVWVVFFLLFDLHWWVSADFVTFSFGCSVCFFSLFLGTFDCLWGLLYNCRKKKGLCWRFSKV